MVLDPETEGFMDEEELTHLMIKALMCGPVEYAVDEPLDIGSIGSRTSLHNS